MRCLVCLMMMTTSVCVAQIHCPKPIYEPIKDEAPKGPTRASGPKLEPITINGPSHSGNIS
jgi:hypothetical protein